MAKIFVLIFINIIFFQSITGDEISRAVLVHNSIKDIEACKGKLKLELVRVWGGDKEEDENKFFNYPLSVAVDEKNALVYILDQMEHCIKVFKSSGEYVRTIGQRGKGPGDIYSPFTVSLAPDGDIVVYELGGSRIQRFSAVGKSKKIIKMERQPLAWVYGVTSKNEIVFYNVDRTLKTKKLVSILDNDGKVIKEIGTYHDKSNDFLASEKLCITIDSDDNIYAANKGTPVIRKYCPDGKLLMAFTFKLPFKTEPVEISLNDRGDEIKIVREDEDQEQVQVTKKGNTTSVQRVKMRGMPRVGTSAIGVDWQQRIYIMTRRRLLTEKERRATSIGWGFDKIDRSRVDYDIVENIDANMVMVFSPEGKIVAEAALTTFCDGIHVSGNRIFIIDGTLNQRVLEYRMHFVDGTGRIEK
jgi:sugar lactone lactonase YvrE